MKYIIALLFVTPVAFGDEIAAPEKVCGHCFNYQVVGEKREPVYTVCGENRKEVHGLKRELRDSDTPSIMSETVEIDCD